jgi:hypothetical protein
MWMLRNMVNNWDLEKYTKMAVKGRNEEMHLLH